MFNFISDYFGQSSPQDATAPSTTNSEDPQTSSAPPPSDEVQEHIASCSTDPLSSATVQRTLSDTSTEVKPREEGQLLNRHLSSRSTAGDDGSTTVRRSGTESSAVSLVRQLSRALPSEEYNPLQLLYKAIAAAPPLFSSVAPSSPPPLPGLVRLGSQHEERCLSGPAQSPSFAESATNSIDSENSFRTAHSEKKERSSFSYPVNGESASSEIRLEEPRSVDASSNPDVHLTYSRWASNSENPLTFFTSWFKSSGSPPSAPSAASVTEEPVQATPILHSPGRPRESLLTSPRQQENEQQQQPRRLSIQAMVENVLASHGYVRRESDTLPQGVKKKKRNSKTTLGTATNAVSKRSASLQRAFTHQLQASQTRIVHTLRDPKLPTLTYDYEVENQWFEMRCRSFLKASLPRSVHEALQTHRAQHRTRSFNELPSESDISLFPFSADPLGIEGLTDEERLEGYIHFYAMNEEIFSVAPSIHGPGPSSLAHSFMMHPRRTEGSFLQILNSPAHSLLPFPETSI